MPRLKTQDIFMRLKYRFCPVPEQIENIVLIGIDDDDYYRYDEKWPWGREIFAGLIYNICRGDPRVIGINLGYLGESEGSELSDVILKEAFRDAGMVVTASYFGPDGQYFVPHKYLSGALKDYGFTNRPAGPDKTVREMKLWARSESTGDLIDYSFDVKVLCVYYNIPVAEITYDGRDLVLPKEDSFILISADKDGLCLINYTADRDDFEYIPFFDVIEGKVPLSKFKDKIVLVGTTGRIFHDQNLTPLGEMPGLAIIANSLLTIMSGDYISKVPEYINVLLFIILLGIGCVVLGRVRVAKGLLITLGFIGVYSVTGFILAVNNIFWDFFSAPAFLAALFIIAEIVNYGALLMESLRLKNAAIEDMLTGLSTRRYFLVKLQNDLKKMKRERGRLSVVLFSIDNYDALVSHLGTDKGDKIIETVARLIVTNSRKARRIDFIARYGESKFSIILRDTPDQGAVRYARRIKKFLQGEAIGGGDEKIKMLVSVGVVVAEQVQSDSAKTLMDCAEKVLARARTGKEKVVLYNSVLDSVSTSAEKRSGEIEESDLSFVAKELEEKNRELQETISKLRMAHEDMIKNERVLAVGRMASSIHHELNNPLSALRSCLQMVGKNLDRDNSDDIKEKNKKFISMALEEIERMFEMNRNLKDMYKPRKKVIESVDVSELIEEIMVFHQEKLQNNGIEIKKELCQNLPRIAANKAELKQVFLNLLINAQDAIVAEGRVGIKIAVAEGDSGRVLEIWFSDTGCGIPSEVMEKIFVPFFTTKKGGKGTGLGLYVSRQIVEKYGGSIEAESKINKGTVFVIRFPISG